MKNSKKPEIEIRYSNEILTPEEEKRLFVLSWFTLLSGQEEFEGVKLCS